LTSAVSVHTEYLTLIYRLGLKPTSPQTAEYLGLSVRELQRIYNQQVKVPPPVIRLLRLYALITSQNKPPKPDKSPKN
jgi:hypothetical protein